MSASSLRFGTFRAHWVRCDGGTLCHVEQRETWTDQRLDDLADAMRTGFSRVDEDIRDLRGETRDGFASLRGEIAALRSELGGETASVRSDLGSEIRSLRNSMFAFGGGIIIALIGVIGAILARGA